MNHLLQTVKKVCSADRTFYITPTSIREVGGAVLDIQHTSIQFRLRSIFFRNFERNVNLPIALSCRLTFRNLGRVRFAVFVLSAYPATEDQPSVISLESACYIFQVRPLFNHENQENQLQMQRLHHH